MAPRRSGACCLDFFAFSSLLWHCVRHWRASVLSVVVSKRRNSWACIGNPKPEQETIKGTHAQETSAYHTARGARKQPPNQGAVHAPSEDTTHTSNHPPATSAASTDQHGTHRGHNRYHPSAHITKSEAPGQLPDARKLVWTLKRWRARPGQTRAPNIGLVMQRQERKHTRAHAQRHPSGPQCLRQ